MTVAVKRVYEPASDEDGVRVLVDRLWPRGVSKAKARVDLWMKEIAPSDALRRWFHHDESATWSEFQRRYRAELRANAALVDELRRLASRGRVTLLYSAKDEHRNQAIVLRQLLLKSRGSGRGRAGTRAPSLRRKSARK